MILEKSTETLLFKPTDFKEIYDDLHELHDLYASYSNVSAGNITDEDIFLPSGKAVSPIKAAFCLLEIQRTAVFIRGINKAILKLQATFPGERLHILYAGCGPYATLLTPFTTRFTADEIAFHLLDVNELSLDAAKKLYKGLGIEKYVEEWIWADASTYEIPAGKVIHLAISETMLNALQKEPQVAIMLNLIPQLGEKALFIPQEIKVTAQLLNGRKETDRYLEPDKEPERINLGTVYSIGREVCLPQQPETFEIPPRIDGYNDLSLLTDITTFDDEHLGIYHSSLNMPVPIARIEEFTGRKITFTYTMGKKPGFVYEWL